MKSLLQFTNPPNFRKESSLFQSSSIPFFKAAIKLIQQSSAAFMPSSNDKSYPTFPF